MRQCGHTASWLRPKVRENPKSMPSAQPGMYSHHHRIACRPRRATRVLRPEVRELPKSMPSAQQGMY